MCNIVILYTVTNMCEDKLFHVSRRESVGKVVVMSTRNKYISFFIIMVECLVIVGWLLVVVHV